MLSLTFLFLLIAFICALLAAVGWPQVNLNLFALGFAFFVLAQMIGQGYAAR